MSRKTARPLSPHLSHYKWGPHMAVSILHRVTGVGLATVGAGLLAWWLYAVANGGASYDCFLSVVRHPLFLVLPIGLTWAFFQHLASGVRHLILDTGAGYELRANRTGALAAIGFAAVATLVVWAIIFARGA